MLPGSATITPGGADFSIRTSSHGGQYDTLHFYVRDELIREIYDETFASEPTIALPPWVGVMDDMLRALANEIRKMLLTPFPGDALYAETLSRTAAGHLVRHYASERHVSVKPARELTAEQCNRAIEYIEECLGDDLSLARIAKAAGVSAGRLNSEFKRRTKLAPHQYVLNARVRRANTLLTTTDMSLAEIAFQCGFSNQQHMTRMVRRLLGRTPGNIRRDR